MGYVWKLLTGQLTDTPTITTKELEDAGYTIEYEGNIFTGYYPISATSPAETPNK